MSSEGVWSVALHRLVIACCTSELVSTFASLLKPRRALSYRLPGEQSTSTPSVATIYRRQSGGRPSSAASCSMKSVSYASSAVSNILYLSMALLETWLAPFFKPTRTTASAHLPEFAMCVCQIARLTRVPFALCHWFPKLVVAQRCGRASPHN